MIECERRPNGTRNEHERSGGQLQEQKDLEVLLRPHRQRTPDGGEIGNWIYVNMFIYIT